MRRSICVLVIAWFGLSVTVARGQETPKTALPSPAETNPTTEALTEMVGVLAGLQVYNTYLNIGLLADGLAAGLYEPADAYQLLGSVVKPLEQVELQLDKLAKHPLSKGDLEAVQRIKKITTLLRQQGKELDAYWTTGKSDSSKKYDAARQAAWKEISSLLDLEPKVEKLSTQPRTDLKK
jgi:hypothetical protein